MSGRRCMFVMHTALGTVFGGGTGQVVERITPLPLSAAQAAMTDNTGHGGICR